jgi:hypothetical protein
MKGIFFTFYLSLFITPSVADSLDIKISEYVKRIRAENVDTILIHRYSLFNGRFQIPYDSKELVCDGTPTVAHVFWFKNNQWHCKRIDTCSSFETIDDIKINYQKIVIDPELAIIKSSPHFVTYEIKVLSRGSEKYLTINENQLQGKNQTCATIKRLNKIIKGLEHNNMFHRSN